MVDQDITVTSNLLGRPDYAEALGQLCAFWANIEWHMFLLFVPLSGAPHAVARSMFYSIESNRGRRELIKAVGQTVIQDKALAAELDNILVAVGKAARVRNKYVHDTWGVAATQRAEVFQLRLGDRDHMRHMEQVTVDDLRASSDQIQKVTQALNDFRAKIEPLLPPWLEIWRAQPGGPLGFAKKGHPPGMKPKGFHSRR